MVSVRTSLIWNSHPGYPERVVKMRRGDRTAFRERLATDEVFHTIDIAPKITDFHGRELGK